MGRLTDPMYLPKVVLIMNPSAGIMLSKIAEHLNALESPDEAAFYTSGRTSNEASFVYQLFAKSSEPIICPIVPICAMKLPDRITSYYRNRKRYGNLGRLS